MRVTTGGGNLSIEGLGILGISSLMLPQGKIASEVFYLDYVHPTLSDASKRRKQRFVDYGTSAHDSYIVL